EDKKGSRKYTCLRRLTKYNLRDPHSLPEFTWFKIEEFFRGGAWSPLTAQSAQKPYRASSSRTKSKSTLFPKLIIFCLTVALIVALIALVPWRGPYEAAREPDQHATVAS